VQVLRTDGGIVQASPAAPATPLVSLSTVTTTAASGLPDDLPDSDMRISGQRVTTPVGDYLVLVGGDSEVVESTIQTVALLLCAAAPVVIAVVAAATYLLVKRSLRSVDAIRARVAEISTSDLSERVPVPEGRDEIAALAETMNAMLARLETGHNSHRRFVGDASHELRSPLATIISVLDVTRTHPELLNAELAETMLMPEAHRMQSLIEDLLLLARADEQGLQLRRDTVALDRLAADDADRLRRNTSLSVTTQLSPIHVDGNTRALARVLRNLTDNAARYARSCIHITVTQRGGKAVLEVADDGAGIPAEARDRVFDRFYRLDTDRARRSGGTGLGLAIVAEIVSAHHGSVIIGERTGGGTVVTVQLPLDVSAVAASR
jgi:signal transduction histidine kinase